MYINQKLIATYTLTAEDIDYTEYCYFNMNAYKELLTYIILIRDRYNTSYSIDNYNHFMREYKDAMQGYQICVRNLLGTYAPEFVGSQLHDVVINFEEMTMNIYLKEFLDEAEGDN